MLQMLLCIKLLLLGLLFEQSLGNIEDEASKEAEKIYSRIFIHDSNSSASCAFRDFFLCVQLLCVLTEAWWGDDCEKNQNWIFGMNEENFVVF